MAYQLTYADRENLLRTFDSLKTASKETDERILQAASKWIIQLQPRFGFELALTRDVTTLSRYLTGCKKHKDIMDIARGALLYIIHPNRSKARQIADFGPFDVAFICNYAVYEIRTRLGESAVYNPPKLTRDEMKRAEELLLEFIDEPIQNNEKLISDSKEICEKLGNLATCGLFKRLQKNIDFLIPVLSDSSRGYEHKSYARAALRYLVCVNDIIGDRLGIIGYLDDNFIAQLAVDLIEPAREPWLDLLDATVGEWPFLNKLIIDDGSGARPFSEYMIINSAVSCSRLREDTSFISTVLILPDMGPVPFLLGFVSTLGLIQASDQREVSEESFQTGQKLIVDYNAIAEFCGFKVIHGRKMFGLKQYHTKMGESQDCINYWPLSDLNRLVPVDQSRVTRGKLIYDKSLSEATLPALEYLFQDSKTAQLPGVTKHVVVVMPVATAHDMAKRLTLYEYPLKDVVPMGHLSSDGEIRSWSTRFGQQEPLLIFVSDLDIACEFAEDSRDQSHLVIVDVTGRNAKKTASLRRLQQFKIPTLAISTEKAADELSLIDDDHIGLWEWTDKDFSALLWPVQHTESAEGPIVKYERRLQSQSSYSPETRSIPFPLAERAFNAVRQVQSLARRRGDERLTELDDVVALNFRIMTWLLRLAAPLTEYFHSTKQIESYLNEQNTIREGSRYLSEEEQKAAARAEKSLKELLAELQRDNPKANIVHELLVAQPSLAIMCPDVRIGPDLGHAYSDLGTTVLASYSVEADDLDGVVVPGWFRKDRMGELLIPPVTKPLYLVLYDIEHFWYCDFLRDRRKACERRWARGNRAKLFSKVEGWRKPEPELPESPEPDRDSRLQELEAIHDHVRAIYRQRVYKTAKSDGIEIEVPAHLVIFEGDFYGFLTESYNANVVTHLLDASVEDLEDKAEIKQKPIIQLKLGDALLFHRGSDRDVIRTAADEILTPGRRTTSSLWRRALLNYVTRQGLTSEDIWRQLRDGGCPLKQFTIKTWLENDHMIAPQAYNRDVRVIAEVTGDESLTQNTEEVLAAIREVRGAHLRVSHRLARQVMARAINILKDEGRQSSLVEIESNVVVARIVEIDDQPTQVRTSLTNRLLEGEKWHE